MAIEHFRVDNTQGYDAADLAALNTAWNELTAAAATCDSPPLDVEMHSDYWSETLLYEYDNGRRGDALLAWFYRTGGT